MTTREREPVELSKEEAELIRKALEEVEREEALGKPKTDAESC